LASEQSIFGQILMVPLTPLYIYIGKAVCLRYWSASGCRRSASRSPRSKPCRTHSGWRCLSCCSRGCCPGNSPIRNMPDAIQLATYANLLRLGINLVHGVARRGIRRRLAWRHRALEGCWI